MLAALATVAVITQPPLICVHRLACPLTWNGSVNALVAPGTSVEPVLKDVKCARELGGGRIMRKESKTLQALLLMNT